jgi:hypothetical protein
MTAVYRPRRRWRRWTAFAVAVFGLTILVMATGVFLTIVLTTGPDQPRPVATPSKGHDGD